MAEKKYLTLDGLQEYDALIKGEITEGDSATLSSAKSYTDSKTSSLASTTTVDSKISSHNTSTSAHSDIRNLISALSTKVNNFLDVDDTTTDQLSEVLTLINNNKGTLESLTSSKINVSDIVDNLTTSSTSKVLSAKQGVALKALIDALQTAVDGKADASHVHAISDITNLQSTLDSKAASSHSHTITAAATDDDVIVLTGTNGTNKVTFDAKHATSGVAAGTYKSVTVNAYGHVTGGTNPTTISGYGITDAYTKTQVDSAINSAKVTVDTALSSSSTNPVQNKVVNSAISTLTSTVSANTSSISSHTTAISNLQTAVAEIQEITSEEITALFA